MYIVSVFPEFIEKEVVEDVGHLTAKYKKNVKKFYRKVEIINDNLLSLCYISNDGEYLFNMIKGSDLTEIKKDFDKIYSKLELKISDKEWKYFKDLEMDDLFITGDNY